MSDELYLLNHAPSPIMHHKREGACVPNRINVAINGGFREFCASASGSFSETYYLIRCMTKF